MNGILIIDKPSGWTSHDVIAKLRGALRQKRVGHGGTLDPMATGVLPVFIGRATRAAEYCENAEKEYIAGMRLGVVTDTQDITGSVISRNDVSVGSKDLIDVLPRFTGALKQIPPMYSAVKKDGKKLYELARRGIDVPREARDISISTLELLEGDGSLDIPLRVVCSKGTYIRTLCHDIGAALGCGATLSSLRRTRAGVYGIDEAHTLDDVLSTVLTNSVNPLIMPVDSIFSNFPSLEVESSEVFKVKNGAVCRTQESVENGRYRVYSQDGEFLVLGDVTYNTKLKTVKSFFEV